MRAFFPSQAASSAHLLHEVDSKIAAFAHQILQGLVPQLAQVPVRDVDHGLAHLAVRVNSRGVHVPNAVHESFTDPQLVNFDLEPVQRILPEALDTEVLCEFIHAYFFGQFVVVLKFWSQ